MFFYIFFHCTICKIYLSHFLCYLAATLIKYPRILLLLTNLFSSFCLYLPKYILRCWFLRWSIAINIFRNFIKNSSFLIIFSTKLTLIEIMASIISFIECIFNLIANCSTISLLRLEARCSWVVKALIQLWGNKWILSS